MTQLRSPHLLAGSQRHAKAAGRRHVRQGKRTHLNPFTAVWSPRFGLCWAPGPGLCGALVYGLCGARQKRPRPNQGAQTLPSRTVVGQRGASIAVDQHRYLRRRSSLLVQSIDFEPDDPSKMRSLCVSDAPTDEFLRLHQCNYTPLNSRMAQTPARSSGEGCAYSKVWRLVSSRISGNGNQGAKSSDRAGMQRPGR